MLFADDLHWLAHGPEKFTDLLLAILVWEALGTPFAWDKAKGGLTTDWLGYWLDYQRFQIGISESRASWVIKWLGKLVKQGGTLIR